jgi:DNA-binding response OmpR family regulator
MAKILLAEDDPHVGDAILQYLVSRHQYDVEWVMDGLQAAEKLSIYNYDVIIVDWEMPHKSGLQLVSEYRDKGGMIPALFLTGRDAASDKIAGLDSGADDYMTKPVIFDELAARIRSLLRRRSGGAAVTTVGDLVIDTANHSVRYQGELIHLAPREYALLEFLVRHRGHVFSNEALLDRVWGSSSEAGPEMVRATIKRIRKKLGVENSETLIRNVFGTGYVLD